MAQTAAKKETSKNFVGTWELVPADSKFQFDNPPSKATLLVKSEKGGLFMRAEWLDPKKKKGEIEHELVFNKPTMVNGVEVTLQLVDGNTLDTVVAKDLDAMILLSVLLREGLGVLRDPARAESMDRLSLGKIDLYVRVRHNQRKEVEKTLQEILVEKEDPGGSTN